MLPNVENRSNSLLHGCTHFPKDFCPAASDHNLDSVVGASKHVYSSVHIVASRDTHGGQEQVGRVQRPFEIDTLGKQGGVWAVEMPTFSKIRLRCSQQLHLAGCVPTCFLPGKLGDQLCIFGFFDAQFRFQSRANFPAMLPEISLAEKHVCPRTQEQTSGTSEY